MAKPTQPLRDEHKGLLPHIEELRETADKVGEVPADTERRAIEDSYRFLTGHLRPHAEAEERVLYPVVERLMGASEATATMKKDHAEIIRLTGELGSLLQSRSGSARDASQDRALRSVLYGLHTLVKIHFIKEEEVYLPLLDARMSAEEVQSMYAEMEKAAGEAMRRVA